LVKVQDWLRLGGSLQTSTNLGFSENYHTSMTTNMNRVSGQDTTASYVWDSPLNSNTYRIKIPGRYMLNAAFILGDLGVISADYMYTDYSRMKMKSLGDSQYDYKSENGIIQTVYRGTHQARVGLEMRVMQLWRARAGFIYQQSPFVTGQAVNTPIITYSLGGGFRNEDFFVDVAFLYNTGTASYYMFQKEYSSEVKFSTNKIRTLVSAGFRF
jgi:long-subunit fatty acid transport protein